MTPDRSDIWSRLAARFPAAAIRWRQDGKPTTREGKFFARFVAYIDANLVRERLDSVVPGEWDCTLEALPRFQVDPEGEPLFAFKAKMQILGVIREDVGTGRDPKAAATDAFKRAAVRFGIGHELYDLQQNWVQVDKDSRFAKPIEDPMAAYARRYGGFPGHQQATAENASAPPKALVDAPESREPEPGRPYVEPDRAPAKRQSDDPACPDCGGKMWDNRESKRNPKAPDFKCRDRGCSGVIWPPKNMPAKPGRETPEEDLRPRSVEQPALVRHDGVTGYDRGGKDEELELDVHSSDLSEDDDELPF